jgi:DNA-binding MarR family transcriptional regulator
MSSPSGEGVLAQWAELRARHRSIEAALEAALHERLDLSLSELETLERVAACDGYRIRMTELAACAGLSKSGMTRLVDRLESEGLLRREHCPSDRRGAEAVLTPKGRRAMERGEATRAEVLERLLA